MSDKRKKRNAGITLIALVVTIIILIILAGVSMNMVVENNGILTQAQRATEDTKQAQEKERIQLAILQANMEEKIENEENIIGIPLYDRTIQNGTKWHILTNKNNGNSYGSGWNYIAKGTSLANYGEIAQDWLVNLETGEMLAINKEDYVETYYGMNLAVTEGLLLNVDPVNMQDENSWGEGVTLYGVTSGDGYGYNGDAIVLDGVDDYIEIYADTPIEKGFTFEFFGRSATETENLYILSKSIMGDTEHYTDKFRIGIAESHIFDAAFSNYSPAGSNWQLTGNNTHWLRKELGVNFYEGKGNYITVTAELETNTVSIYVNGQFLDSTICSHEWLVNGKLTDNTVPFTIGLRLQGPEYQEWYSSMELYTCRLYDRVLTDEEIIDNYDTTVAYRQQTN